MWSSGDGPATERVSELADDVFTTIWNGAGSFDEAVERVREQVEKGPPLGGPGQGVRAAAAGRGTQAPGAAGEDRVTGRAANREETPSGASRRRKQERGVDRRATG